MKNAKLLWRILGYVLIPALFFCFGNSLRAQTQYTRVTSLADLEDGTYVILDRQNSKGQHLLLMTSRDTKDYKGEEIRSTDANSTDVEYKDVDDFAGFTPVEIRIEKSGNFYTLKDLSDGKYLSANTSATSGGKENLSVQDEVFYWEISASNGIRPVGSNGTVSTNHIVGMYGTTTQTFSAYKSGTSGNISLYKKQEVAATCDPVTNVQVTTTATSVSLTWTAPATVPANGYEVIITDMDDNSEVVKTTVNEPTYTCNSLQEDWAYEYSIKSLCSATSGSTAVTGEFETPKADAKGLSVALSGDMEGDKYTGPITFTFTTTNFNLSTDGRVKYSIMGDNEAYTDVENAVTAESSLTFTFPVGYYIATFELVDDDGNSLSPKVEVQKEFTVKLPKAKAPEFSPAAQTEVFTTAQTITLSSQTADASLFYRIGDEGEFAAYQATGIVLNETGTFEVSAFATKTGMENSDTITKTYTLKLPLHIDGVKVASYDFSKGTAEGNLPEGWSAQPYVTGEGDACRLGSSSAGGSFTKTEPALLADFTIYLRAKAYSATEKAGKVSVTVNEVTKTETLSDLPKDEFGEYALPFSFASAKAGAQIIKNVTITVATTGTTGKTRFLIQALDIYQATETPEECGMVTLPSDGGASPTSNGADITWNAPAKVPANGYRVTVTGPNGYNESKEVGKEMTEIEWTGLVPETEYTCKIVSVCGEDSESEPVEFTFTTESASVPSLNISSPAANYVSSTGNVGFKFTTTNFELGDSKLVKAELKEYADDLVNAPVIKTLYTKEDTLTISGLKNGKYHVDLYMAEVRAKSEGSGNDTVVVGFDPSNPKYVHRTFEVKLPAVYFAPNALKIKTFRGVEATDTVKVTGWALPENTPVSFASDNTNVTVTPATLTQAEVMATGGAKIAVAYNGAEAAATAKITATCGTITAEFNVNAIARDTLANLKGIYSRADKDTVLVRGKMVVTHKDSKNSRIWVQDIEKENGASMLLYNVTQGGYADIEMGDVLENIPGKVAIYHGLYEFTPLAKLEAVEHNHAIYVDTMSVLQVRANSTKAEAQNALVCIKDVRFKQTGNFASGKNYTLLQGKDTLVFRADFSTADYIGKAIPTYSLYATVLVGYFDAPQVMIRKGDDMAEAPCLVPTGFADEVKSSEATIEWEGSAASYSVRYAKEQTGLESATPATVNKKSFTARGLEAETTYYYQVKSLCSATNESEWSAVQSFTTLSAHAPAISMISPVDRPMFTDSVPVHFHLENVTLKAGDTTARIVFSDGKTVENYTDTVYKYAMPSGDHSVQVILTKNDQKLNPSVETRVRYFSVDLPDVAKPEFAPKAGRYKDSVEVTLNCDTEGASIFYAQGEGEWVAYTAGSKIVLKESATLKAFACKERMDTSAVATATYTITKSVAIEGDLVFEEYFDKVAAGTAQIADKLDENTTLPGWTGNWVYQHTGGGIVRLGKSKSLGWIETPAINLSENNGKFMVSFYAQAWKGDKDTIRVVVGDQSVIVAGLVNDKETNNTAIADLTQYVVTFDNGTAETKIKFEAITDKENNRYFLDSIRVYQVLPDVPRLSATPAMFEMKTVQGTPATQTVTVKGNRLASDVTVTCLQANNTFSVSAESLTKEAVMGENGAELTVTFNASVAEDSAKIELVSGNLHQTVMVRAFATPVVEVENIAALRAGELTNTIYKVKGEVVVTAVDGISTWVQDASAAIQIYGSTGTTYAVGDGITGIFGTLSDYHGLIELTPNGTQPAATSHDNKVEPEVMTVEELNEKGADYSSRLIRINGLTLSDSEATDGKWKGGNNYTATDEAGKEIIIRTILTKGSYVGEALPKGKFDLIVIAGYRDGDVQVSPRVKEDIIAAGGGDEDDCEAPTNLMYSGSTKITVKWNGSANEYKLALLSKDGKDTVMTKMLTVTEYTFGDEVKPNVEYGWAVASVCENGKLVWAKGQNFQIETANEEAELQADVYPNPTDGVVYIKLAESVRLEIFTLGGTVLRSEELAAGRNEIRLDRSGIYFIRLTNGTATTVRRVVVR